MKLTTKNLLLILGALVIVLAVTQLTKRGGRSKSLKSELVAIDTAKVSKIEIVTGEENVTLSMEEKWKVSLPDGSQKTAKESSVISLLNSLNTITPGRMAAKSPDKWKNYSVDSTGTRVKVFEENEILTDIVIGRFGVEGQQSFYTFVRLFEDNEVYVANGFMGASIGKDAASYRDNEVLRLQKDSLFSISFNYPDSAFKLTKGEEWYLQDRQADSASVAGYLNGLSFVSSREFYDRSSEINPTHTVIYEFSNRQEIKVEVQYIEENVVLKSSENPNELFADNSLEEKILKGRSEFLATGK
ncbi:MAG: DUF4340 domain-containing protein [Ekhidna sp.]|nr:DUF4340 domain-containing protein [Ekhidna sp.]